MKFVTVDIWDTVIRRNCHPDDVKKATSDYIINKLNYNLLDKYSSVENTLLLRQNIELKLGRKAQKQGFDDEYKAVDVIANLIDEMSIQDVDQNFKNEVVQYETEFELNHTYVDPTIFEFIMDKGFDECYFISDFYYGADFIKKLLQYHNVSFLCDGISSCDVGYNKRSGRLFDWFLDKFKDKLNSFSEHYHIGDNEWSDVKVPSDKGIKAYLFMPKAEHEKRLAIQCFFKNGASDLLWNTYNNSIALGPSAIGKKHSVLYYGYCRKIISHAKANSLDRIFFMTREGEFFKKIYEVINNSLPPTQQGPEAKLLCVSRIATFFPSLREISLNELMRVWNLYSTQSMAALFKTLGIELDLYKPFGLKYKIPADEDVVYPWLDERINNLFLDNDFIKMLESLQVVRKLELNKYLNSIELLDGGNYGLVDIGWRGTIQDNICYLQASSSFTGYYLGLEKFLNEQPLNSSKIAFGPNINISPEDKDLFNVVAPIEMLCNSRNGSVVGYEVSNGVPKPIRKIDNEENVIFDDFTSKYQSGVIAKIKLLIKDLENTYVANDILKSHSINIWKSIIHKPEPQLADAYFSLVHNEDFGLGKMVDKSQKIVFSDILKAIFFIKSRVVLKTKIQAMFWPQGYFNRTKISKFDKILSFYTMKFAILYKKIIVKWSK